MLYAMATKIMLVSEQLVTCRFAALLRDHCLMFQRYSSQQPCHFSFISEWHCAQLAQNSAQLSVVCLCGQSSGFINLLARHCLPLTCYPFEASGACEVVQSLSNWQCSKQQANLNLKSSITKECNKDSMQDQAQQNMLNGYHSAVGLSTLNVWERNSTVYTFRKFVTRINKALFLPPNSFELYPICICKFLLGRHI